MVNVWNVQKHIVLKDKNEIYTSANVDWNNQPIDGGRLKCTASFRTIRSNNLSIIRFDSHRSLYGKFNTGFLTSSPSALMW